MPWQSAHEPDVPVSLIVEALVGSAIDAAIGVVAGLATGYVAWLVGMPFALTALRATCRPAAPHGLQPAVARGARWSAATPWISSQRRPFDCDWRAK